MIRKLFIVLLLVLAFLCGRVEGWREADAFMADCARSLGVRVQ